MVCVCVRRQKQGLGLDQMVTMTNKSPRWNEQVRLVHHPQCCCTIPKIDAERLMACTVAAQRGCNRHAPCICVFVVQRTM